MVREHNHSENYGLQAKILRRLTKYYGKTSASGDRVPPMAQARLSTLMAGKRRPTPEQAVMLERVFQELGFAISKFDMVFAYKSGQPILALDKTRENQ